MKLVKRVAFPVLAIALLGACEQQAGGDGEFTNTSKTPKSEQEIYSYGFGVRMAQNLIQNGVELDESFFQAGASDAFSGEELKVSEEVINTAIADLQKSLMEKAREEVDALANDNLTAAQEFLAENGLKEGVQSTESGLQYEVVVEGQGPKPTAGDMVTVHYEGGFLDGQVFDSSLERGEPAQFPLNAVIAGWTEAVQLMGIGSTYKLYVPPALGYGERGAQNRIPPNSLLIFEVQLLGIEGVDYTAPVADAATDVIEEAAEDIVDPIGTSAR